MSLHYYMQVKVFEISFYYCLIFKDIDIQKDKSSMCDYYL